MTDHPRVTVGLPVYNGEEYLAETLDSLLGQTYANFELIIGDNGSTDATQQICATYAAQDKRIRYLRSKENRGATWNYNRLVPLARGEYFRWTAHDDLVEPTYLEKCVAALDEQPDAALVFPQTMLINEENRPLQLYLNRLELRAPTPHERLRQLFRGPGLCNPIFGLIRTETLQKSVLIQSYPDSDRVLLGQLALYGRFYEVKEPLFLRRIHPKTSVAANPDFRSRTAWFDPRQRANIQLPKWRRFRGYASAINKADIETTEKVRCYQELGKRFLLHPRWMVTDIQRALGLSATGKAWTPPSEPASHI